MTTHEPTPTIVSARPEITAALMAETGLDEAILRDLVHRLYEKVRCDAELGPVFEARIADWEPHLDRMVAFWSSVALMTGRYHGAPMPAHATLPVTWTHFDRWLTLFRVGRCGPGGTCGIDNVPQTLAHDQHWWTPWRFWRNGRHAHGH